MLRIKGKNGKTLFEMTDNGDVKVDGEVVTDANELKEKLDEKEDKTEGE
jgi:hypothetical protein